jgi:hypothetical protein
MDELFGAGNGLLDYVIILIGYAALFVIMRYANPRVEPNFRLTYWALYLGWAIGTFFGNYLFYKLGIMSFLPWLNNFIHTFIWIGFCLSFLYAGCYQKPFWEQFLLFSIFSFIVKALENQILGTWELERFFIIQGNTAYIIGWSIMDGLYPVLSVIGLTLLSKFVKGIVIPKLFAGAPGAG